MSPVQNRNSIPSNHPLSSREKTADNHYYSFARETENHWIGPFPVDAFLDEFLAVPDGFKPAPSPACPFDSIPNSETKDEKDMYETLVW